MAIDKTINGTVGDDVLVGGFGNDRILGGAGNDILYGDGRVRGDGSIDPNATFAVSAVFGGSASAFTNTNPSAVAVTGYVAGQQLPDAVASAIGGHSQGIGVLAAQASRPSIKQETGWDPIKLESEGIVFSLDRDAASAKFDLTYFFGSSSSADSRYAETGKWVAYKDGRVVASSEFTATASNGKFTLNIPEINGGNTYFDTIVLEGRPYANTPGKDNHGLTTDSSDFLVKSASFETVGHDRLFGGEGNDQLFGGYGNDHLSGGAGADLLDGGKGRDHAVYATASAAAEGEGFSYGDAENGVAAREFDGVLASLADASQNQGEAAGDVYVSIEGLVGSKFDDVLIGDDGANWINAHNGDDVAYGGAGNDRLNGGNGDDVLIGGTGNDWMTGGTGVDAIHGGAGTDTAAFNGRQGVHVDLSLAADVRVQNDGNGNVETLTGVENLHGGGQADLLIGDAGANTLWGNNGNDVLIGDAFVGKSTGGNGSLSSWSNVDLSARNLDGSVGKVSNGGSWGVGVDNDRTINPRDFGNNQVSGQINHAPGYGPNGASEALVVRFDDGDGAAGFSFDFTRLIANEAKTGEVGVWRAFDAAGNEIGSGTFGKNAEDDGGIHGTGEGTVSITAEDLGGRLAAEVRFEAAAYADGFSNRPNDSSDYFIRAVQWDGEAAAGGNDHLRGGNGDDILIGGAGNDVLGGDRGNDFLSGGSGIDTVNYAYYKFHDGVTVDLSQNRAEDGFGGVDTIVGVENVTGSTGADTLIGDAGANRINGHNDDDVIDGGAGADRLFGDRGDDVLIWDDADFAVTHFVRASEAFAASRPDLVDDEGFRTNSRGDRIVDQTYNGGSGFDILDASAATGTVDLAGAQIQNFEAVFGDGQAGRIHLDKIWSQSDADDLSNAKYVDPFDDYFLAVGLESLSITGAGNAKNGWHLVDAQANASLGAAIDYKLADLGFAGDVGTINAFTFERGAREVTVFTDLDSLFHEQTNTWLHLHDFV